MPTNFEVRVLPLVFLCIVAHTIEFCSPSSCKYRINGLHVSSTKCIMHLCRSCSVVASQNTRKLNAEAESRRLWAAVCSERRRKVLLVQSCTVCEDLGQSGDGKTSYRIKTSTVLLRVRLVEARKKIAQPREVDLVACFAKLRITIQSPDTSSTFALTNTSGQSHVPTVISRLRRLQCRILLERGDARFSLQIRSTRVMSIGMVRHNAGLQCPRSLAIFHPRRPSHCLR